MQNIFSLVAAIACAVISISPGVCTDDRTGDLEAQRNKNSPTPSRTASEEGIAEASSLNSQGSTEASENSHWESLYILREWSTCPPILPDYQLRSLGSFNITEHFSQQEELAREIVIQLTKEKITPEEAEKNQASQRYKHTLAWGCTMTMVATFFVGGYFFIT